MSDAILDAPIDEVLFSRPAIVSMRRGVARMIDDSAESMRRATEDLADKQISGSAWQKQMTDLVKLVHTAATAAAYPEFEDDFPQHILDELSKVIEAQLDWLDNFARELRGGEQALDGTALTRAEMYAEAAHSTFELMTNSRMMDKGYAWERRILRPGAQHCQDCIGIAARGWRPIGTLPGVGTECACGPNCKCHFEYSKQDDEPAFADFSVTHAPPQGPEPGVDFLADVDRDPRTERLREIAAVVFAEEVAPKVKLPAFPSDAAGSGDACIWAACQALGVVIPQTDIASNALPTMASMAGLSVDEKKGLSLEGLCHAVDTGKIVLCRMSKWGGDSPEPEEKEGHWVVVTGYDDGSVYFEDPMLPAESGHLTRDEFDARWYDRHDGKRLFHNALILSKPDATATTVS